MFFNSSYSSNGSYSLFWSRDSYNKFSICNYFFYFSIVSLRNRLPFPKLEIIFEYVVFLDYSPVLTVILSAGKLAKIFTFGDLIDIVSFFILYLYVSLIAGFDSILSLFDEIEDFCIPLTSSFNILIFEESTSVFKFKFGREFYLV